MSNRGVAYSASSLSVISHPRNQYEKPRKAYLRFRIMLSAKDFSTSLAVCSGIAVVALVVGAIAVDSVPSCFLFFIRIPRKPKIKITSFALFLSLDYYPDSYFLNQYLVDLKQGLVRELLLDPDL